MMRALLNIHMHEPEHLQNKAEIPRVYAFSIPVIVGRCIAMCANVYSGLNR